MSDFAQYCQVSASVIQGCTFVEKEVIQAGNAIIKALAAGRKLIALGNGGSASMAEHFVAELVGRFEKDRRRLNAISLTANSSVMTALINDFDPQYVFALHLKAIAQPGDIVFAFSTSGLSTNIWAALEEAINLKCVPIMLTSTKAPSLPALQIKVASLRTALIQQAHLVIIHALCAMIDKTFENHVPAPTA